MLHPILTPVRAAQVSWLLAAIALIATLKLHLLSALFAGLLVYELIHVLAPYLRRRPFTERSRLAAVVVLSVVIVGLISAAIVGSIAFFRSEAGSLSALLQRMADIIDGARASLPAWVVEKLPADADELRLALAQWLRANAPQLQIWGTAAGRIAFHVVLGMIIGAMLSLREATNASTSGPLALALEERASRFGEAFRRVVFAQVRIALINAAFTAIYLLVLLPAFDVRLPFTATLIAITFVAGLLPVVGNVISNTVIVVLSLAHSPLLALVSLGFLVTIHKLEYFLNARIIGSRIHAHAWELLLAILVMEAAFGLTGAIAAPVYYAWLKQELVDQGLV
jgi:predicted PurR-regulated permease PerM